MKNPQQGYVKIIEYINYSKPEAVSQCRIMRLPSWESLIELASRGGVINFYCLVIKRANGENLNHWIEANDEIGLYLESIVGKEIKFLQLQNEILKLSK